MSPCCRSLRWRSWPSPPSAKCLWDDDGCVSAAATGDKIKFERRKLKKEVDGWGVKVCHNIQWQSQLCPCCHTSSALIWWLPPFSVPLHPVFFVSSRSVAPLSLSVFTRFPSFCPPPPPPTRAPSPLYSRRLISRAASRHEYLRKEKSASHWHLSVRLFAPLLYFLLPLIFLSSLPSSHSLVFFFQEPPQWRM